MQLKKIPATVVTGFLGSGKTTLLSNVLRQISGGQDPKRIAVIVNEFGELDIDADLLRNCPLDCDDDTAPTSSQQGIYELANGCICCTVEEEFLPVMLELVKRRDDIDHILIETSGLALPQPLVRAFNWPKISTQVTVDGVVTVVDGKAVTDGRFAHSVEAVDAQRKLDKNLDHETPLSELFEDQVACADMLVVNKTDLLNLAQADALVASLKQSSRNGVQIVKTSMGKLPVDVLLGQGIGAETDLASRHEVHHHHDHDHDHDDRTQVDEDDHHKHDHDAFESFVVNLGEVADTKVFADQVSQIISTHDILRLKGFAAVVGKPMRLTLQAVGPRVETYFDQPFDMAPRITQLVVIGQTGLDRPEIEAALNACTINK